MLATVWVTSHLMLSGGVLPPETPPQPPPPLPPKKATTLASPSVHGSGGGLTTNGCDESDGGDRAISLVGCNSAVRPNDDFPNKPTSFAVTAGFREANGPSSAVIDADGQSVIVAAGQSVIDAAGRFSAYQQVSGERIEQNSSCDALKRGEEEETKQTSHSSSSSLLPSQFYTSQVRYYTLHITYYTLH